MESTGRRLSPIWIVPLAAVVLGGWLAVQAYLDQGPTITIRFNSAEGIEAEKTLVKVKNVTVGSITRVRLANDLSGVVVTAELEPDARRLLREDSQFWVMKAEVRAGSVSGLGTLLSGAFVELSPGIGRVTDAREFIGLDQRPVSPSGTPGMGLRLVSESSGSVSVGSPVLYRGYRVGSVEQIELDVGSRQLFYSIFIDAPFDELISSNTRFWNASGVSAELSTEGVKLSIGSLQSALVGGVSFDLPRNTARGGLVDAGTVFRLYPDEASIHVNPFRYSTEYVVMFEESLRGLLPDAPVTYRGIRIGSVVRIMLEDLNASASGEEPGGPLPVLIQLEPGRLALEDSEEGLALTQQSVAVAVERGLRDTMETGNLLTGARLINLDFYEVDEVVALGDFIGYPTIPSIGGGLDHIQVQVSQVLDKINQLPVEGMLDAATGALTEARGTLAAVKTLVEGDELQGLPLAVQSSLNKLNELLEGYSTGSEFQKELIRAMEELKQSLQSVEAVADRLKEQPSSLVFPSRPQPDPVLGESQ